MHISPGAMHRDSGAKMLKFLCVQVLYPKEHDELKAKLRESQARGSLEKALDTLKGVLDKQGTSIVDLSGRPKNLYGVFKKMKDKQRNVNDVLDVRALRVIVRSKTDCYEVLRQVCFRRPSGTCIGSGAEQSFSVPLGFVSN